MKIVDANIVLRYLLNDDERMSESAADIIENNQIFIPNEVIAEIVYVLEKVYRVGNDEISTTLRMLFSYDNFQVTDAMVVHEALNLYGDTRIDFVDTLLFAYHKVRQHEVYTFDKQLNKLISPK